MHQPAIEQLVRKLVDSPANHCFVCSRTNPLGLQLSFDHADGVVSSRFIPCTWHEGWQTVVHGGILAALLDEAMAYTLFFRGIQGVTAKLEVRYRSAVRPSDVLDVQAHITRDSRRLVDAQGRVLRGEEIVAEAVGRYLKQATVESSLAESAAGPPAVGRAG